jgi:hypothetical protein
MRPYAISCPICSFSMNNDAEIHAINRRISVPNSDLTLKVFRVLRYVSFFNGVRRAFQPIDHICLGRDPFFPCPL